MDIRTIPVDVSPGMRGELEKFRYKMALHLCDIFCDGLTVITPALGRSVRKTLKSLNEKVGIWTSGVQLAHFERNGPDKRAELGLEGKKVLLYHGVLSSNRGLQNAVNALFLLRDEFSEMIFLLVGDGPAVEELKELSSELGLEDRVIFTGKVPYNNIAEYVRVANCAILPFPDIDWWQVSSPIKLMEYLAIGVPVVATNIEAHRFVVNQTDGAILVDNETPKSLSDGIRQAINYGILPADRSLLEQFISWNSQAQNLENFLEELL
jgi:glycosyltransferase involved in cell wall biosynthesis